MKGAPPEAVLERLAQAEQKLVELGELPERLAKAEQKLADLEKQISVRRVLVKDAIKALKEALDLVPQDSLERVYQKALEEKLKEIGLKVERPHVSTVDGHGVPDIFVPNTEPPLLIEIKSSGDWRGVAEAAAQLHVYGELLSAARQVELLKLAVFGGPLQHESLKGLLDKLDIRFIQRS